MPSVWVKWRLSPFDYSEITINDVLGEVSGARDARCEARGEVHNGKTYIVKTKRGVNVLCRSCCKILGLPVRG
jgi:hypothetical protein